MNDSLRNKAEEALQQKKFLGITEESLPSVLHELRVHQIELEMQNDELRMEQQRNKEITKRLYELYHQSPVGYVTLNQQAIIIECNQTFQEFIDYPATRITGKSITQFMVEAEKSIFLSRYTSIYKSKKAQHMETCLQKQTGEQIDVRFDIRPADHLILHSEMDVLLVSITDISEMKRAQKELIDAKCEAERANQAKSQFLSQMSHNLRTPLNAVLGFAQILEDEPSINFSDKHKFYLQHIIQAGRHLLELIEGVLNLSQIEAGRLELHTQEVNLLTVIEEAVNFIEPLAIKTEIKVLYNKPKQQCYVKADPVRLKESLLNLLSNAVKYNRANGRVELNIESNERQYIVHVKDTGLGLSIEQQYNIFKPFQRYGAEYSKIEGSGIGLSICKHLIEAMDGEIKVESLLGKGSTFSIYLPKENKQREAIVPLPLKSFTPSFIEVKANILYIEDNVSNIEILKHFFEQYQNINFLTAMTPHLGFTLAEEHLPDVILLDIQLPEMNGFEAFKILQTNQKTKNIPVIAVSAYAMPNDVEKALNLGFYDYVTKPIDFVILKECISQLLILTR